MSIDDNDGSSRDYYAFVSVDRSGTVIYVGEAWSDSTYSGTTITYFLDWITQATPTNGPGQDIFALVDTTSSGEISIGDAWSSHAAKAEHTYSFDAQAFDPDCYGSASTPIVTVPMLPIWGLGLMAGLIGLFGFAIKRKS